MKKLKMSSGSRLPEDCRTEVLKFLPVKSVLRFRCVCKSWNSITREPLFAKLHCNPTPSLSFYPFNSEEILEIVDCESLLEDQGLLVPRDIPWRRDLESRFCSPARFCVSRENQDLGSCNGFLCFGHCDSILKLWTPTTGEAVDIPFDGSWMNCCLGFGWVESRNKYKLVKIICRGKMSDLVEIEVFSLRTATWVRRTDEAKRIGKWFPHRRKKRVFSNGAHYWVVHNFVTAFDLAVEKFHQLPLPDFGGDRIPALGVLGGSLCCSCVSLPHTTQVWVMKDHSSWIEVARFDVSSLIEREGGGPLFRFVPLFSSVDGDMIAVIDDRLLAKV